MSLQAYAEFERTAPPDEVEAYRANFGAFKGGLSRDELAKYYNEWAEKDLYDVVCIIKYL